MRFVAFIALALWALLGSAHAGKLPDPLGIAQAAPVPVLDLKLQSGPLDSRIAFARASSATYFDAAGVLQTVTNNVPRFGSYLINNGQTGLMIEGSSTNFLLWNRDLTQIGTWVVSALSSTALDQTGIDGAANSASSFTAGAANATVCQATVLSSAERTASFFLKRITGTGTVSISMDNGSTYTAETITSSFGRFAIFKTLANPTVCIELGTSGDEIAIDYAQLETPSHHNASSPMLTTSSTFTRAADVASLPFQISLPFTMQATYAFPNSVGNSVQSIIGVDNGSTTNRVIVFRPATGIVRSEVQLSGVTWVLDGPSLTTGAGTVHRTTTVVGANLFQSFTDGGSMTASTSTGVPAVPPGMVTLYLGEGTAGGTPMFGTLYRVTVWLSALPTAVIAHNSVAW